MICIRDRVPAKELFHVDITNGIGRGIIEINVRRIGSS